MGNKCSKTYIKKFEDLGINTNGSAHNMESIITGNGFGLPCEHIETDATEWVTVFDAKGNPSSESQVVPRHYYGFTLNVDVTYTRLTFTYADALSEELILLKTLSLI